MQISNQKNRNGKFGGKRITRKKISNVGISTLGRIVPVFILLVVNSLENRVRPLIVVCSVSV